ncbi:MAG: DnaJ domain-containing protein [Dehalococcoidia bacterium]|nr:DnaJ domain-containing protein [Dehalococcoidia bacterium]
MRPRRTGAIRRLPPDVSVSPPIITLAMSDPFKALGLPPTATLAQVKARYRELAKQHHPDAGNGGSAERMAQINAAYHELCSDLEGCRRRATTGAAAAGRSSAGYGTRPARSRPTRTYRSTDSAPTRAGQWKDWLERAKRAAEGRGERHRDPYRGSARPPSEVSVSPAILTLCRHHGGQTVKVSGEGATLARVAYPSGHVDVTRGASSEDSQAFNIRLTAAPLPSPEGSVFVVVRLGVNQARRIPIYEFSCPSGEGACAFAT